MSSPFAANVLRFPTALIPKPSEIGWTNFERRFNNWYVPGEKPPRTGPMRSNPVPFRVAANAPAIVIALMNPERKGLLIQNLDPTDDLFIGFGSLANANSLKASPGQAFLFDMVCPCDAISVFATASIGGFMLEMARQAE